MKTFIYGSNVISYVKISRRTGVAFFFLALLSSFLTRYPIFKVHSGGFDSEFILYLSKSIARQGTASWVANSSSYFGLHRFSYPLGSVFLYSSFIQVSSSESEYMILLYNMILVVLAVASAFLFGLVIRKKDYLFAFLVAYVFGMSPVFILVSSWTLSARGLFMIVFSILILISFSEINRAKKIFIISFFIILIR